jgi:hypothetical protein
MEKSMLFVTVFGNISFALVHVSVRHVSVLLCSLTYCLPVIFRQNIRIWDEFRGSTKTSRFMTLLQLRRNYNFVPIGHVLLSILAYFKTVLRSLYNYNLQLNVKFPRNHIKQ